METNITITREDADLIQTTLGRARIAVSKINPTLAYQLLHCIKALDPKPADLRKFTTTSEGGGTNQPSAEAPDEGTKEPTTEQQSD